MKLLRTAPRESSIDLINSISNAPVFVGDFKPAKSPGNSLGPRSRDRALPRAEFDKQYPTRTLMTPNRLAKLAVGRRRIEAKKAFDAQTSNLEEMIVFTRTGTRSPYTLCTDKYATGRQIRDEKLLHRKVGLIAGLSSVALVAGFVGINSLTGDPRENSPVLGTVNPGDAGESSVGNVLPSPSTSPSDGFGIIQAPKK